MDNIRTAGPVPQVALHNALQQEQDRQNMNRGSDEVLLDEEGIALDDLANQISPSGPINPPIRPVAGLNAQFHSSNNTGQKGWRRSRAGSVPSHRETMDVLTLGRLYQKLGKLSVIPRYFLYIAPLAFIIAIPLVIGAILPNVTLGVCPCP
jgi:hypothetical protein